MTFGLLAYPLSPGATEVPDFLYPVLSILFPLPIYVAAVSGAVVMPIAAKRSKDQTLRRNLEWFFVFIALQLVLQGESPSLVGPLHVTCEPCGRSRDAPGALSLIAKREKACPDIQFRERALASSRAGRGS